MSTVTIRYDLRAPASLGASPTHLYPTAVEQCAWADEIGGFDQVVLSEHHGSPDGYCPAPAVFGAAVAARTQRIGICLSALVLPLHDPLEVAEQLAVLDLVAGGRLIVVFGAGYRPAEFAMFDRPMAGRGRAMERSIQLIRAAWRGEEVTGPRGPVRVTPRPASEAGPVVLLGGSSEAAARRAARVADGFMPGVADPVLIEAYHDECRRLGRPSGYAGRTDGPMGIFVAEDPEAAWARIAPHVFHESRSYGEWEAERPGAARYQQYEDADALKASGTYLVLTPNECVAFHDALPEGGGLLFHPLCGGLDPEVGWASLELFASAVLPRIRPVAPGTPGD